MKLYLTRHTSVDVPKSICYGQTDVPLKDSFESEADIVKQRLNKIQADAVFSSPLSRCVRLALHCGYEDAKLYDRLKELNFGDWEMQEWEKVEGNDEWFKDWVNTPTKNGESFKQMYDRLASFFEELKKEDYDNVIIFAHGGIIACAKVYFGEVGFEDAFKTLANYGETVEFELK